MSETKRVDVWRYADGALRDPMPDDVACEEPLEIRVRGRAVSVAMRTPGHDAELAAGFLLTEGVVAARADILDIRPCDADRPEAENRIDVLLAPLVNVDFDRLTRHVFASSSCGVCGKATIESVQQSRPAVTSRIAVDAKVLLSLPEQMRAAQRTFDRTGGIHAAAIFDRAGDLVVLREDVGRHNAVDKVIGYALLHDLPLEDAVLFVSGRTSFEILQKSLAARIPVVAAVSAPSSLAVEFAVGSGQTLIGFVRGHTMNVYANPQRVRT